MSLHMHSLRSQLRSYGRVWQHQSDQPKQDWELQLQLRLALSLYDFITAAAEHREHEGDSDDDEMRDVFLRDIQELYALWTEPSGELLMVLKNRKGSGLVFEGIGRLETLCFNVERFLKFDVENTIRSLYSIKRGEGVSLEEARDELRRKVGS